MERKIAIIFIGTNKYFGFFPKYYKSTKKYFIPDTNKDFFVFTNKISDPYLLNKEDVFVTEIQDSSWPYPALYRFKYIKSIISKLKKYSHIIFIDADMYFINPVLEDDFFCHKKPLFGVEHPAFIYKTGPFELREGSLASVDTESDDLSAYFQACFFGGESNTFINMVLELDRRIDLDLKKTIIAIWNSESHLNKYFSEQKESVHIYDPGFAYIKHFKHMKLFKKKIIHMNKKGMVQETFPKIIKNKFVRLINSVKFSYRIPLGFYLLYFKPKKTIVLLTGHMRSGTTLMKALLGEASDVSNLPEVDYNNYSKMNKFRAYYEIYKLSEKDIIVLKRPYSTKPPFKSSFFKLKIIIMKRNIFNSVVSLKNMTALEDPNGGKKYTKPWSTLEAIEYCISFYLKISKNKKINKHDTYNLYYEDLISDPKEVTKKVFKFIGSKQNHGVDSYKKPRGYEWKWGFDDGGDKIKSLKVQQLDKIEQKEISKIRGVLEILKYNKKSNFFEVVEPEILEVPKLMPLIETLFFENGVNNKSPGRRTH